MYSFIKGITGVMSLMCSSLRVSLKGNPVFFGPLSNVISKGTPILGIISSNSRVIRFDF